MPCNHNVVSFRFCHASGDRTDTDFSTQFYADTRRRICVFEVMDKLSHILNGVNVVVRRRAYKPNAGRGMPYSSNCFIYLAAR